ncbi:MAG: hypothetical protein ACPGNV_06525 [Mangrovicoccus sp.]
MIRTLLVASTAAIFSAGLASASVTSAVPVAYPTGTTIVLDTADGTYLPGLDVFVNEFYVTNFVWESSTDTATGLDQQNTADFVVDFYDASGALVDSGVVFSGEFDLLIEGASTTDPFGVFDFTLTNASFTGLYEGVTIAISLDENATLPSGTLSITENPDALFFVTGDEYIFDSLSPLSIAGGYTVDDSPYVSTPGLTEIVVDGDVDAARDAIAPVPLPATGALAMAGFAALGAARRFKRA